MSKIRQELAGWIETDVIAESDREIERGTKPFFERRSVDALLQDGQR